MSTMKKTKNKIKKVKEKKKEEKPVVAKPKDNDSEATMRRVKIKVIGVGGGGGNIIAELLRKLKDFSYQKVDFVAVNTDNQALKSLPKALKTFSFGNKLTRGLGTGRDVEIGEKAAKEDIEKIKHLLSDDKDLYIIVSSLGGGTGTGATPIIAKIAEEMGLNTLGIFTTPFAFEGRKKMELSVKALEKIKESLNAFLVLPNEKIFNLTKEEVSFADSLNLLNDKLAESLEGLLRTIYSPGLINIDWADIRTILEGRKKVAYLNFVKAKSSQNAEEIAKLLLKNPILDYKLDNADNVMFNVESGKELSLQLLSQVSEKISEFAPNAKIIFGLSQNPKMKNELKITILATGSEAEKKKKEPKKVKEKKKEKTKKKVIKKEEEKDVEIRRSALDIKEAEKKEMEKEDEDEKIFEIPAFLRTPKKK
ncbi:MAG: cell division protein FtsZ [Candidatus Pacebacteria bacterium]|nr:cell division protein FtsZ [Candidatus Paceibacterota bacterium]